MKFNEASLFADPLWFFTEAAVACFQGCCVLKPLTAIPLKSSLVGEARNPLGKKHLLRNYPEDKEMAWKARKQSNAHSVQGHLSIYQIRGEMTSFKSQQSQHDAGCSNIYWEQLSLIEWWYSVSEVD